MPLEAVISIVSILFGGIITLITLLVKEKKKPVTPAPKCQEHITKFIDEFKSEVHQRFNALKTNAEKRYEGLKDDTDENNRENIKLLNDIKDIILKELSTINTGIEVLKSKGE